MSNPSQIHQSLSIELSTMLNLYLKTKKNSCKIFYAPFDGKRCNGAPDFIIDIISPTNPSDDYIRKLYCYENALNIQYFFESSIQVHIFNDLFINFSELCNAIGI